ncbi:MAG: phenylalanine 4-monooxygenase [Gammaproteobacteria bacterium]|nr:phenylalanine 4-monooxygenase [Gammaproteobacteria bacterium]MCH9744027.1 phenylalanine 4-monooxygenase [Gammaproteobacteria bacterium]
MKTCKYIAKTPDEKGICHYSDEENQVWQRLYDTQMDIISGRACDQFIEGLEMLKMPRHRIPQLHEVSEVMMQATGWSVAPVAALITPGKFFGLLANRQFPAATFIRTAEEFNYVEEPDIFHELFGHCPLLLNPAYADFVEQYGQLALKENSAKQNRLLRLFWMTIEFGLVDTAEGLRIYGGGILSSPEEMLYAIESKQPTRNPFNILDALRTPYRIDIKQPIYYILDDLNMLFDIFHNHDIDALIDEAIELGDFEPQFEKKPSQQEKGAC